MKSPIAYFKFFGAGQPKSVPKTKKHTICKNEEIKKLKHTGTFACIFDRHAKTFATDAGRYVGWERHSVRFQHITLIQEILATT